MDVNKDKARIRKMVERYAREQGLDALRRRTLARLISDASVVCAYKIVNTKAYATRYLQDTVEGVK